MYKDALEWIRNARSIALVSHINPDADALGSSLGMYWLLKSEGIKATVVNTSVMSHLLDFLPGFQKIQKELPQTCDLVISFDCGNFERLGIPKGDYRLINIDHHISNSRYGDLNIVDDCAASSGSVVLEFAKSCSLRISSDAATCLYSALASDTGFFRYENTTEKTFNDAALLTAAGAKPQKIAQALFERVPLAKLRLHGAIIDSMQFFCDARAAFGSYDLQTLKHTGATKDDAEGAVEMLRTLSTVEVSLLVRQEIDGSVRGSLRSKNYIDVNRLAGLFGGGGHIRAAGFTYGGGENESYETKREAVYSTIVEALKEELR